MNLFMKNITYISINKIFIIIEQKMSILYWYIYHRWAIFDHLENMFFLIQDI